MRGQRNLWGALVLVAIALIVILRALNVFPDGLFDIIVRSAPALLIFWGAFLLLRRRIPFGGIIALAIVGALVVNIVLVAFSSRANQLRDDYSESFVEQVSEDVSLLRVQVDLLSTDVNVRVSDTNVIESAFVGSAESLVSYEYQDDELGAATFSVEEVQPNEFQLLQDVGRGIFDMELPDDTGIDLLINAQNGTSVLDLGNFQLERFNLNLQRGSAQIVIPAYEPQNTNDDGYIGVINVFDGDITLFVSEEVGLRLEFPTLSGGEPAVDETIYNVLRDRTIESRNFDNAEVILVYQLRVPNGNVTIQPLSDNINQDS